MLAHDPGTQKRMVEKIKAEKLNVGDAERIMGAILKYPEKKEAFLRVPLAHHRAIAEDIGGAGGKGQAVPPGDRRAAHEGD